MPTTMDFARCRDVPRTLYQMSNNEDKYSEKVKADFDKKKIQYEQSQYEMTNNKKHKNET